MPPLTTEQLAALRHIDTPTVSNAIERFEVRPRVDGFAGWELRCAFPEIGTTVGYALTCTADSTTNSRVDERGLLRLWEALEKAPQPSVVVIKEHWPRAQPLVPHGRGDGNDGESLWGGRVRLRWRAA